MRATTRLCLCAFYLTIDDGQKYIAISLTREVSSVRHMYSESSAAPTITLYSINQVRSNSSIHGSVYDRGAEGSLTYYIAACSAEGLQSGMSQLLTFGPEISVHLQTPHEEHEEGSVGQT